MKIVIVGGHLSPALAVIDALPKDAEVLFVGRKYTFEGDRATSLEYETIKSLNIPFIVVSTGRLQRKFTRHTIPSIFKIPYGFIQSFFILKKFKPDVVLSFGGYLSIPVGISAFLLRIPLVIHEQTLEAGLSNRVLSFFAKKVCISWESSRRFFPPRKTVLTGNPIRDFQLSLRERTEQSEGVRLLDKRVQRRSNPPQKEIATLVFDKLRLARNDIPVIYITGGSGGSHYINVLVEGCIKELLEKFIIIHQTGDAQEYRDYDRLNNFRNSLPSKLKARYYLTKFVEPKDIGSILHKTDLVIGRSGMNTVTELVFFQKPSLLIPLPYSQNNEQVKNALFFKDLGLGEVLYQSEDIASNKLLEVLVKMFNNIDRYKRGFRIRHSGEEQSDDSRISNRSERFWTSPSTMSSGSNGQNDGGRAAQKIVEIVAYEARATKKKSQHKQGLAQAR